MLNWKSFKWIGLLLTIVMSDDLYILDLLDKSRRSLQYANIDKFPVNFGAGSQFLSALTT